MGVNQNRAHFDDVIKRPVVFGFPRFTSWILKKKMSSATSSSSRKYITAPFTPYQFEDELASDLEKDDSAILEKRYASYTKKEKKEEKNEVVATNAAASSEKAKSIKSQTQWTRALDVVQEHFSSHVILDGVSQKIPPQIYALKHSAKRDWILYKKRECERRKRIREKIKREKTNEQHGKPANVLLAMVDSCESCRRLYVTVNLFWGVTLCDSCYFNPEVINGYMTSRLEAADHKVKISSENIVEEVMRFRSSSSNNSTASVINTPSSKKRKRKSSSSSSPPPSSPTDNGNANFFCVTPFKPPPKGDAMVFNERPAPTPPTSPGETPGNDLEKMEVAEGIMFHNDDPYFEDVRSPSPLLTPPPPPPSTQQQQQQQPPLPPCDFSQFNSLLLFTEDEGAGENSNTMLGCPTPTPTSSTPFNSKEDEEEENRYHEEFGIEDEDYSRYALCDFDLSQRSQGCWF